MKKQLNNMQMTTLPKYVCKRCKNEWTPRTPKPKQCPKCKSPYWNKPRKFKKIKK